MLSKQTAKTDIGEIIRVDALHGAIDGTEYCIRLNNGNWHYISKYRLDRKPIVGETAEITRDMFDNVISLRLNGIEHFRQYKPFFS